MAVTPNTADGSSAERWLPVVGYEGCYEVSDLGRVRSIPRARSGGGWLRGRILKQQPGHKGYYSVRLCSNGVARTYEVHLLVAAAFLGPRPDHHVVCHGPAGRRDNSLVNLSYGTYVENAADMYRDGTVRTGARNPRAKLTEEIVRECRVRAAAGESYAALAREFGCSDANINEAVRGIRWSWLPGAVPLQRNSRKAR